MTALSLSPSSMVNPARLLGFAFANADYLFEVDDKGMVVFATGASSDLIQSGYDPVGMPAARLFLSKEAIRFATLSRSLAEGNRAGPFQLKLATGTDADLSLFRLPMNGNQISCTLSKPGPRGIAAIDASTGIATREGFLEAAQTAGENDTLALVNLPGLPTMCDGLGEEEANNLLGRIGEALTKIGVKAAGRLSNSRFGVIADAVGGSAKLAQKIRDALKESGAGTLDVQETLIALKGKDISDAQRNLVVHYVVGKFAKGEWRGEASSDAAALFAQMLEETQETLRRLTETVADGAFDIAFQPIVNLSSGETSHFEALARFSGSHTEDTVGMLEALGVADAFDLAVAAKVLAVVESPASNGQRIAFNVSGKTVCAPSNFGLLAGLLARKRALSNRVLIEITESAEIDHLADAAKAVSAMRELGFKVGIDDFGAGAASLSYLHELPVDFVKFDGALIAKLGQSKRDDVLLAGLVKLCKELGVRTVAEKIETAEQVAAAKAMGFDLGQGYHFGAGTAEVPAPAVKISHKRKGVQESWG